MGIIRLQASKLQGLVDRKGRGERKVQMEMRLHHLDNLKLRERPFEGSVLATRRAVTLGALPTSTIKDRDLAFHSYLNCLLQKHKNTLSYHIEQSPPNHVGARAKL